MLPCALTTALLAISALPHEPASPTLEYVASLVDGVNQFAPPSGARQGSDGTPIGYFLRSFNMSSPLVLPLNKKLAQALDGLAHFRLLPGAFPHGMEYHFDGLATVVKMTVANGQVTISSRAFESGAYEHYNKCLFYGTGTGPKLGSTLCFQNPAVNLLPIYAADGHPQLWLTIDTSSWGRIDPDTLDTIAGAKVEVGGAFTLNAHPACDPTTNECFVQHPCPASLAVLSKDVCISTLEPRGAHDNNVDMPTVRRSHADLPYAKMIQHSHSPCVTPRFVVAKLDAFHSRNPLNANSGLLKFLEQGEDDLWMVMDRTTNVSRILKSPGHKFVNNHFWNCYEDPDTNDVIVETVPATREYLDNYFARNLRKPSLSWSRILTPPLTCRVPAQGNSSITCAPMFASVASESPSVLAFDYPTFNPRFKMHPYRFFYAIAPSDERARWFDTLIKVDRANATRSAVVARWHSPNIYLTEADFVPTALDVASPAAEDDGMLVTILYNASSDQSMLGIFDAESLSPMGIFAMGGLTIPFHAHGIVCPKGERCFTNP